MSRKAAWALSAALVFVIGVSAFLFMELHRLSDRYEELRPLVLRTQTRDALLDRSIPDLRLPAVGGDSASVVERGDRPHVVWSVSPDRCIQCLEGLGEWRRMAQHPRLRAVVILEGVAREEAETIVRETGLDGTVLYDPSGDWHGSPLGGRWPGMVVLGVDPEGRIRSVASRENRGSCRWSAFDYTLAAVQRLGEAAEAGRESLTSTGGR